MTTNRYEIHEIKDEKLKFAVMICTYEDQLVFVQHKLRNTLEFPGGHREANESILACAQRELWEETGAIRYELTPRWIYGVQKDGEEESYGMLYTGNIMEFEEIPKDSEIERRVLCSALPEDWTYPKIQPYLYEFVKENLK